MFVEKKSLSVRAFGPDAKRLSQTRGHSPTEPFSPVCVNLLQVARSLNVVWLISNGSLEDPLCLMEVCAAVRQGTPVLPVRLAGDGMRPLNLPIWGYSIATKPSRSAASATANSVPNADDGGRDAGGGHELTKRGGNDKTAADARERAARLRRRAADGFYAQVAQRLPKPVQVELHRNNFLVKDVIAAVRACFESAEENSGGPELSFAGAISAKPEGANPPIFDVSAQRVDHNKVLTALVGGNHRETGEGDAEGTAAREEKKELPSLWNWEQIPRTAPLAGRARVTDAVPWRTEEETLEMIRMENAEADDLAGEDIKSAEIARSTSPPPSVGATLRTVRARAHNSNKTLVWESLVVCIQYLSPVARTLLSRALRSKETPAV